MSKLVLEIEDTAIKTGFVTAIKEDEKGQRRGFMPLGAVVDLFTEIINKDSSSRQVRLISRFADSPYLAYGMNGTKWVAVKEIPPGEYFLTLVSGEAYKVNLPRLVAKVSNFASSYLFWTKDDVLTLQSKLYPLIIGNIDSNGWICLGSTGLKCQAPDGIDKFVRQVIEAPSTGTYVHEATNVGAWYQHLTQSWDESVGARYGTTLKRVIEAQVRE